MRLFRYRKAFHSEMRDAIKRNDYLTTISDPQIDRIIEEFENRFGIFVWRGRQKPSPLFRLTILFYWVYYLLVIIGIMIKWLFTGDWGYSYKDWPLTILTKWSEKLGL